ncbi:MAG: hypothetical protein M0P13_01310 [Fibrobacteraceae bacterium]|nr:hypothetical protein [Fibrobacteraceae bacterium]
MAIPKIIHYCWLSKEPYPPKIENYQKSWRDKLGDFKFKFWDANAFDINRNVWVKECIAQKKWAFAADYIRLYAIFKEGGIYLDSDVEVLQSFDPLLELPFFFGFENGSNRIEAATFGAEAGNDIIRQTLNFYESRSFSYEEKKADQIVLPRLMAEVIGKDRRKLKKICSISDFDKSAISVFAESFFSPKSFLNGKISITPSTFSIHHFESSWRDDYVQKIIARRRGYYKKYPRPVAALLSRYLSLQMNTKELGIKGLLKKIAARIFHKKPNISKSTLE